MCVCVCVCVCIQFSVLSNSLRLHGLSMPCSSVHGIFQVKILERVAISYSGESSWSRDWIHISFISCIGRWFFFFYHCPTWEAHVYSHTHSSVQFSRSVMSDSLQPHELQHARPPCPSPTPGVYSDSCPSSQWCHPAISSSVVPFSSCPQSLPESESFSMSQLFSWGGQSTGVSASASFPPKKSHIYILSLKKDFPFCKHFPPCLIDNWIPSC